MSKIEASFRAFVICQSQSVILPRMLYSIPLNDVDANLGLGIVISRTHAGIVGTPDFKVIFKKLPWLHHRLGMDERFTIVLSDVLYGGVVSADLLVIVNYRPWFLPIRREKRYRFVTYQQTNRENHWRSFPLDAPRPEAIKY